MTPEEFRDEAGRLFDQADELEHEANKIKLQIEHAEIDRNAGREFDEEWAASARYAMKCKGQQCNTNRRKASHFMKMSKSLYEKRRLGDIKEFQEAKFQEVKNAISTGRAIYQVQNEEHLWQDIKKNKYDALIELGHSESVRIVYVTPENDK